jgi:hypothetical protein
MCHRTQRGFSGVIRLKFRIDDHPFGGPERHGEPMTALAGAVTLITLHQSLRFWDAKAGADHCRTAQRVNEGQWVERRWAEFICAQP